MNMNLVDDVTQTLRRTRNEDINRQQKEIYLQMASQMIQSMQDEQSRFKRLANMKGNYNPDNYRLYFGDPGLLIATLDEEAQLDLRRNKNFNTYKGAIYENIVADMLVKEGYNLYFYRDETGRLEMDFFVRDTNYLIPVEVKAGDNSTISLNNLIDNDKYKDIKYGIKLCNKNIGFNGKFYTFPYFLTFLLKRYLNEKNI